MENTLTRSPARKSLLIELWRQRVGVPITETLPVTKKEIREEVRAKVRTTKDDYNIMDEESVGIASQLVMDALRPEVERESDILLSQREKATLARERDMYRWEVGKRNGAWLIIQNN